MIVTRLSILEEALTRAIAQATAQRDAVNAKFVKQPPEKFADIAADVADVAILATVKLQYNTLLLKALQKNREQGDDATYTHIRDYVTRDLSTHASSAASQSTAWASNAHNAARLVVMGDVMRDFIDIDKNYGQ